MRKRTLANVLSPSEPAPVATARPGLWTSRWVVGALLAFAIGWPAFYANPFLLTMATLIALNAIGAVSLHLIIRTGHFSLGHAAFMGVGGYACVLSVMKLGFPFPLGLLASAVAPGLLALVIGPVVLRLSGKYFVLVTFLLGEIIRLGFVEWVSLTGGSNGILNIPAPSPFFESPVAYYYLALAVCVACGGLCGRILASEVGRAMDAVREAERVAECSGVPVIRLKVTIFVVACALVGIQGALLAHFLRYVDPTTYGMIQSLNFVVMNVLGGMYHLAGPLVGTVFLVALPELLRGYVDFQHVLFGIILIVIIAAFPDGMIEIAGRARRMLAGRKSGAQA